MNTLLGIRYQEYSTRNTLQGILYKEYSTRNTLQLIFYNEYSTRNILQGILYKEYYTRNTLQGMLYNKYSTMNILQGILYKEYSTRNTLQGILYKEYATTNTLQGMLYKEYSTRNTLLLSGFNFTLLWKLEMSQRHLASALKIRSAYNKNHWIRLHVSSFRNQKHQFDHKVKRYLIILSFSTSPEYKVIANDKNVLRRRMYTK